MKTLTDICLANPLKVKYAKVQFELTSDYEHFMGRRDAKWYHIYPLEVALKIWEHPLEYVEKSEKPHYYTNEGLLREAAKQAADGVSDEIKNLIPNIESQIYNSLDSQAHDDISEGRVTEFIHKEIEHMTARIIQVYIPGYHAEYGGQSIDVEPEGLWENPNI